jgi:hypothetical protein
MDNRPVEAASPSTAPAEPTAAEAEAAKWQVAFEGLGLSKARAKAVLDRFGNDFRKAYNFETGDKGTRTKGKNK